LAAENRARCPDAEVEVNRPRGGGFEVCADGAPVFEKSKLGRHVRPGEIVALLGSGTRSGG